jgi:predicted nucleic acid-binding protein
MPRISGRCLLDTNVPIYATIRDDPRCDKAVDLFERARSGQFGVIDPFK